MKMTAEKTFQDAYVLTKTIGSGNTAILRKCRHKFSKTFYACKIIELLADKQPDICATKNEINIMRKLKHSNIVLFVDVFFTKTNVMIVTELTELGDLHDYMLNNEYIGETLSRSFSLDISSAVNFMHSNNIVHRDIKSENCLVFKNKTDEQMTIKLCDFGLAEEVPTLGLKDICGSPSYVAPEILQGKSYGLSVDIWSMGVIFFLLLCQCLPFEHNEMSNKFDLIMYSSLSFTALDLASISNDAKDLVRKMLVRNPKKRLVASDVLYHKWFTCSLPVPEPKKSRLTFKAASIAIRTVKGMEKHHHMPARENAILSQNIIESIKDKQLEKKIEEDE